MKKLYKNIIISKCIMDNNNIVYFKTDDNKIINENSIRWVKKMNDCLEVCIKITGCNVDYGDTHKICKLHNLDSYNKLNKHFE
jgi:hypothetical protein